MTERKPYYVLTLDSHDYFGPFQNTEMAHHWAKLTNKRSYTLTEHLPSYAQLLIVSVQP
jgi:hypothetical protein